MKKKQKTLLQLYKVLLKDMKLENKYFPPVFICCSINRMNISSEEKELLDEHFQSQRTLAREKFEAYKTHCWWECGNFDVRVKFIEYLIEQLTPK